MNYQIILNNQNSQQRGEQMAKGEDRKAAKLCGTGGPCCSVEAVVSIDARGQIVLPKDVRDKAEIEPGDKLAVIAFQSEGKVCCISLVKSDTFADSVKGTLGPMMSEILQS
jgi:AbrB family looped-hinge helix DNA binding protein